MSDESVDLKSKIRDSESRLRTAEAALKDAKSGRLKLAIWSAVGGFMLFAVGGQWFPGYQLDSTAEDTANTKAMVAVSEVMAQLCAERFMRESGLESRMAGLNAATGDWSKATYIRDGTWATAPDGERADHATADKCRGLIAERVAENSEKSPG